MKRILFLTLALSLSLNAKTFEGEKTMSDEVVHHLFVQARLNRVLGLIENSKSAAEFEKKVSPLFLERDRVFVKEALQQIKWPLKISRLNRGIEIEQNRKKLTITIENLSERRFRINDRIDWIYTPDNPLRLQAEVLATALEKKTAWYDHILLNQAHAGAMSELGKILFAGLVIAGVFQPAINDSITTYWKPMYKARYCKEIPQKKADFEDYKYCEDYYKYRDAQVASKNHVPDSKPSSKENPRSEQVRLTYTCAPNTKDKKEMVVFAEGKEKFNGKVYKITTKHTIEFSSENKPLKIKQESVQPETGVITIFEISGNIVETIRDNHGKFLSRKKDYIDMMTPEKIKQMEEEELIVPELTVFVAKCNKKADEEVSNASSSSSLLAVGSVKAAPPNTLKNVEADATPAQQ